jgi:hypothetical protein
MSRNVGRAISTENQGAIMDAVTVTMKLQAITKSEEVLHLKSDEKNDRGEHKIKREKVLVHQLRLALPGENRFMLDEAEYKQPHIPNINLILPESVDVSALVIGSEIEVRITPISIDAARAAQ